MIKKFELGQQQTGFLAGQAGEESPTASLLKDWGESFTLQERAVPLLPDLGEVADRSTSRIGNEMESVSGAGKRGNVHFDFARVLNEVSGELILWIGGCERGHSLHSAPTHFEGVENGSDRVTHRMACIQAVRNREGIERTIISDVQHRRSVIKIDFDAGGRY